MNWKKGILLFLSLLIVPSIVSANIVYLDAHIEHYYTLNETTGLVAEDIAGTDDGTWSIATIQGGAGKLNYSADFGASANSEVELGVADKGTSSNFTFSAWVDIPAYSGGAHNNDVIYAVSNPGGGNYEQYIYVAGHSGNLGLEYILWTTGGSVACRTGTAGLTGITTGYHMITSVAYESGGTDYCKLYVDGALYEDGTGSGWNDNSGQIVNLGRKAYAGGAENWVENIDEVSMFNASLDVGNITTLYDSGTGLFYCGSGFQAPPCAPPNNPPTITNITNQIVLEDTITLFPNLFTISDAEDPISNLTLSYNSNDTSIINNVNGIVFDVANLTGMVNVTVTPEPDAYGIAMINITVTDTAAGGNSTTFTITVTNVNDAPTISTISDVNTLNGASPISAFTVLDIDNPYTDLTYSASSNNAALFSSTLFSNSNSSNQNFTMVIATWGSAIVNVTVSDLEPLSDSTTFEVHAYCNTSIAPYNETTTSGSIPSCYQLTDAWNETSDIYTYGWFDYGNTSTESRIEIYRTTSGSWDLVDESNSSYTDGNFTVNLSAYPNDDFQIRGYITDATRSWSAGGSEQRIYTRNIDQQLNLPSYFKDSDGIIYAIIIMILFLTIGIASQSATMTLILTVFGLFFATKMVLNVPSQFIWATGVVVAILIWLIAKLRID